MIGKNKDSKNSKDLCFSDEDSDSINFEIPFPVNNIGVTPSSEADFNDPNCWNKEDLDILEFGSKPVPRRNTPRFLARPPRRTVPSTLKIDMDPLTAKIFDKTANKSQIECTLLDLKQLIDDCYKTIQNCEDFSLRETNISIGNCVFTLKIIDQDILVSDKCEVSKHFKSTQATSQKEVFFPESVLDYCKDYELDMEKAFNADESLHMNQRISVPVVPCKYKFMDDLQLASLKQSNQDQNTLKQELEWQRQEIKVLKGQLKAKLQELACKEKLVKQELEKIKKDQVNLVKETVKIEKSLEDLNDKKEKYSSFTAKLQKIAATLSVPADSQRDSFISNTSYASIDQSFTNDEEELKSLEHDLKDLESQCKSAKSEAAESLQLKISRIKSRINGIKSEKIMSSSINKSASIRNTISAMQRVYSIKQPLPHKALTASRKSIVPLIPFTQKLNGSRKSVASPLPFSIGHAHTKSSTISPDFPPEMNSARSYMASPTNERMEMHAQQRSDGFSCWNYAKNQENESRDEEEGTKKSLALKEQRLREKEEELSKKENWIRSNLEKNFKETEYFTLVKNEKMSLNRIKKELEVKERSLEDKMNDVEKLENGFREKFRELERKTWEIEAEKQKLDNDKEDLLAKIEEMKIFVRQNI